MYAFVDKYFPRLRHRTTFVYNLQNEGAFENKDVEIKEYCEEGDIIVDFDVDDLLIGRQVFKLVNSVFQDENNWVMYSSYFFLAKDRKIFRRKPLD